MLIRKGLELTSLTFYLFSSTCLINSLIIDSLFLALQIPIFEILPWDKKSYLTPVILPRLSHENCT